MAQLRNRAGSRGSVKTGFNQIFKLFAEDIRVSQRRNPVTVVLLASDFVHDEWNATVLFCEARELYRSEETAPMAAGLAALRPLIEGSQTATVLPVLIDVPPEEDYIRRLSDGYERCYRDTLDARYSQTVIEAIDPDAEVIDLDHLEAGVTEADLGFISRLLNGIDPDISILRVLGSRHPMNFVLNVLGPVDNWPAGYQKGDSHRTRLVIQDSKFRGAWIMPRLMLTDELWERIKGLLPGKLGDRGVVSREVV